MKLQPHQVEKPWGRTKIPTVFGATDGRRIGEIWFEGPVNLPLLTKYIFTSEKLSVQVHPNNEEARRRALPRGKSECWYIMDAEPGATLGLGLTRSVSSEVLRKAALDGSIEDLILWHPVSAGDFYVVPSGTVHAIGAGISLLEFQQNADVTYRLYDYGRPRELHLEDGIAVSEREKYSAASAIKGRPTNTCLVNGPEFNLFRADNTSALPEAQRSRRRWAMPIKGGVSSRGDNAVVGECLLLEPHEELSITDGSIALVGSDGILN